MPTARDIFLIHVPDSTSRLPRLAWRHDAVVRSMDELGDGARVLRVTEGELCRDVTADFLPPEPVDEYPEADDWRPAHTRYMSRIGAFGRRT